MLAVVLASPGDSLDSLPIGSTIQMTGKSGALYKFIKIVPRDDDGNIMPHSNGTNGSYWMLADNYCGLTGVTGTCIQSNGSASTSAQVWNPTMDGNGLYNDWTTMMPITNGIYQRVLLPMYNDLPDTIGALPKTSAILTKDYPMQSITLTAGTGPVSKGVCRLTAGSTSMSWGTATANLGNCTYTDKISLPSYTDWQDGLWAYDYFSGPGSTAYAYSMARIGWPWSLEAQVSGLNWGTWLRSPRGGTTNNGLRSMTGGGYGSISGQATTSHQGVSPVIWLSSSLYLNATLSSPGTYDFPHCLAGDNACSAYPSGELLEKIRNGEELLTYEAFGAVGDGVTDDGAAIQSAHHFANLDCRTQQNCLTVYGTATSTYYIGILSETIPIQTSVDWRGSTIILDDYIDNGSGQNAVDRTVSIFTVESVYGSFNLGVPQDSSIVIKENTTNSINIINYLNNITPADLSAGGRGTVTQTAINVYRQGLLKFEEMLALIEDSNTKRYIRSGSNQDAGTNQQEIFRINTKTGDILNELFWDYNQITRMILHPIDDTVLTLENVNFISYTDNYYQGSNYVFRNLAIERSNVTLENVVHILDETVHEVNRPSPNPQGNIYTGFLRPYRVAHIYVKNSKFQPHLYAGKSTYDITFNYTLNSTLDNVTYPCPSGDDEACYDDYMLKYQDVRWGIMGTNGSKDMVIKNSKLSRIDAHEGLLNLAVTDTVVGAMGLTLIGKGLFYAENLTVDNARQLIFLRDDYGSSWNGMMHLKNVLYKPTATIPSSAAPRIIRHDNDGTWNYGYDCFYPNIIIDGLTIDDSRRPTAPQMSLIPLYITPAQNYPYNFLDSITFKDVKVTSGKLPNVFPNTQNILQALYGNTTKTHVYLQNTPVSEGSDFSAYNIPASQFIVSQSLVTPTTNELAFTIPTGIIYDGSPHPVAVTPASGVVGLGTITVKYAGTGGTSYPESTTPPTDIGKYIVYADIGEGTHFTAAKLNLGTLVISSSSPGSSTGSKGVGLTANLESTIAITTNAVNDELLLDITPNPTGTLVTNEVIVNVSTNNSTGYTLTMNSLTNNTDLVNVLDPNQPNTSPNPTTPLVPTLPVIASTSAPFGTPAVLSANTWGYTLSTPLPTTPLFTRIPTLSSADTLKNTTGPATSSSTTITFGANVNNTMPSGTYAGTIVFTATTNTVPPRPIITSISPTTNWSGGDIYLTGINFPTVTSGTTITVGGTPCASIRLIDINHAICVLPNKPTDAVYPVVITSAALGQGNTNKTVTYDGANKGNMQDFSQSTCTNMPMGLAQIYTDARNNAVYRIKKMLDNKCWMIDNLAYEGGGNDFYGDTHTMTPAAPCGSDNWNDTSGAITDCAAASDWTSSLTTVTNNHFFTTNNNNAAPLLDRIGNTIPNTTASFYETPLIKCTNGITGSGSNATMRSECLSYLYHWCTAVGLDNNTVPACSAVSHLSTNANDTPPNSTTNIARTGVVGKPGGIGGESRGNSQAANQSGVNSTTAGTICPAGWRLPVGRIGADPSHDDTYNESAILNGAMYTIGASLAPDPTTVAPYQTNWYPIGSFSTISSGYFSTLNGLRVQSTNSTQWNSSLNSASRAANISVASGYVNPGTDGSTKYSGMAVRCVL